MNDDRKELIGILSNPEKYIFWLRHKVVLPMKIVLLPYNRVHLYLDKKTVSNPTK